MHASAILPFIPVCCVCGLARESASPSDSQTEWWSDFDEYLNRHGLRGTQYRLTHAYCPVCVNQFIPAKKKAHGEEGRLSAQAVDVTALILQAVRNKDRLELDALARACPQLTWNQVFLEVDRLSRSGHLILKRSAQCGYEVSLPVNVKTTESVHGSGDSVGFSIGEAIGMSGGLSGSMFPSSAVYKRAFHHATSGSKHFLPRAERGVSGNRVKGSKTAPP
jgi:hypothetical protein